MTEKHQPTVVTGLGIAAPSGLGIENYWSATCAGETHIRPATRFDATSYPAQLAGEIDGFEPAEHLPGSLIPQTDRMTQIALVGADCAFADARVQTGDFPDYEIGVVTASSSGGFEFGQNELRNLWRDGRRYVSAYQSFAWFYAVNSGQISIRHEMRGPSGVVVSDQAGGLDAIAQARRQIRKGTKAVVSGGIDAALCPWGWAAQLASGRLSTSTDPRRAYLPFDQAACGHVPGEGGALLFMESAESARERQAPHVYGEISGYSATFDPRPDVGRAPALQKTIELALADAQVGPDEVDVVFADAAAIPDLDRIEAEAITKVFAARAVPVTAPKTMVGRLNSGGAPLDVATALLAMRHDFIPPTPNASLAYQYDIDLVNEGRRPEKPIRTALVLARGFGGFNSALVVRTPSDSSGD